MDIFSAAERFMAMDDKAWARHANPFSAWSRILAGPILFVALWSPFWIGWWALIPIAVAIVWTVINPRLFAPPSHTDAWATKAVLGERVFLNRKLIPIPKSFERAGWITTLISLGFMGFTVYAFFEREFWFAFVSWHAAILGKIWFIDRMAWLWELMKDETPQYQAWARADW